MSAIVKVSARCRMDMGHDRVAVPMQLKRASSDHAPLRVPAKTCHANADLATRLRMTYTLSPKR